mgnify:FL=1|tara:strand:- start:482 stop:1507 length:1026 start_codon:yes stop_codon:yes gene_type:complete
MIKYLKNFSNLVLCLKLVFIVISCNGKREALGPDNEIRVICSISDEKILKELLKTIFNDTLYTPEPEPYYFLKFSRPEKFSELKNQAYLIIAALNHNQENEGSELIKKLLPYDQYLIKENQQPIYMTKDHYCRNQILMIINGLNIDHVRKSIIEKKEFIKNQFFDQYYQRQKKYVLADKDENKRKQKILEKNGWDFFIPWGWEMIINSPDSGFVWIGKEMPFQWISVSWDSGSYTGDELIAGQYIWNMPEKNYKNIRFNDYKLNLKKTEFLNYDAWLIEGLWETINEVESKGGPFRSYLFYDQIKNNTYHINMLIYHPGNNKSLYLRQMDIIARTFSFIDK